MADDEKPRRRRRRWLWLVLGLLVIVSVTAGVSAFSRQDAYLTRFHPYIEPWRALNEVKPRVEYKGTLYIFRKEDAASVLKAMESEFTTAKGYLRQSAGAPDGTTVSFIRNQYGAAYVQSKMMMGFLLSDKSREKVPPGGCAVIVLREPNWLERQVDAVKRFLHWD